jgi:hypothetical protein
MDREILNSTIFKNEGLLKVWVWCLLTANSKEKIAQLNIRGSIEKVRLKPGQFIFGRLKAAKKLKMNPSTLYTRLLKLQRENYIRINTKKGILDKTPPYSVVTLTGRGFQKGSKTEKTQLLYIYKYTEDKIHIHELNSGFGRQFGRQWRLWIKRYSALDKTELALLDTYVAFMNKYAECHTPLLELVKYLPYSLETLNKTKNSLIDKIYIKPINKQSILIPLLFNSEFIIENENENLLDFNSILDTWNLQGGTKETLNLDLERSLKRALNFVSTLKLKESITNYGELCRNKYYTITKFDFRTFIENGLSEEGRNNRDGFWQFLTFEEKERITLETWRPLYARNKKGYYGFSFGVVTDSYSLNKEAVDRVYVDQKEEKQLGHFLWLEELIAIFKYQRDTLPKNLNVNFYLDLWLEESHKPEIRDFIEEMKEAYL